MSQTNVEKIIGQLVTDEACRRRFEQDPRTVLQHLVADGYELTPCELQALANIDPCMLSLFSNTIDSRLQRIDLQGGAL